MTWVEPGKSSSCRQLIDHPLVISIWTPRVRKQKPRGRHSSHLSVGSNHYMPMFSVFRHLSRHLLSCHDTSFSVTRSPQLRFGLPRFRLPSTVICNIFLVASSLSRLYTCPNHLNLFSQRNSAIRYMCVAFQHISDMI